MKRVLFVAGIGLCIFTATMASSNNHVAGIQKEYNYLNDTTPKKKKDTTKPKPDTSNIQLTPAKQQR